MKHTTVEAFMTKMPHTIGHDQKLKVAKHMMHQHGIRHLPVLEGGHLVGLISERDIEFIERFTDFDMDLAEVAEIMTPDPFAIAPDTSVQLVADRMAEFKYGSAIVVEKGHVTGIFTTVDALSALSSMVKESQCGKSCSNHSKRELA